MSDNSNIQHWADVTEAKMIAELGANPTELAQLIWYKEHHAKYVNRVEKQLEALTDHAQQSIRLISKLSM